MGPDVSDVDVDPLGAVIFDLDGAMADIERDGHREAFTPRSPRTRSTSAGMPTTMGGCCRSATSSGASRQTCAWWGFGAAADDMAADLRHTNDAVFADCVLDGDVSARSG